MWRFSIIQFLKWVTALAVSVIIFFAVTFLNATAFPFVDNKQYYLYNSSSQAQIKSAITPLELPFIRGESVTLSCCSKAFLEGILTRYSANVVKTEEFSDGISYYCYSPKLKKGILLDGVIVNLQIAVRGECVTLGTPIIFGGY